MTDALAQLSCWGCKFLYAQEDGYSNYTVMETAIKCALKHNKNLPADEPYDWKPEPHDNWPATMTSRCERYAPGVFVRLDVDGEEPARSQTSDEEQIAAIEGDND